MGRDNRERDGAPRSEEVVGDVANFHPAATQMTQKSVAEASTRRPDQIVVHSIHHADDNS